MNPPDYICFWPRAASHLVWGRMTATDPKQPFENLAEITRIE